MNNSFSLYDLYSLKTLSNYGKDIEKEIQSEVFLSITTPKKSIRYFNSFGTQLYRKENKPINTTELIMLGIDIIESVQTYNDSIISDNERRVLIPFDSIEYYSDNQVSGELDINVSYFPLSDLKERNVTL